MQHGEKRLVIGLFLLVLLLTVAACKQEQGTNRKWPHGPY
jgi:hypothetical protein